MKFVLLEVGATDASNIRINLEHVTEYFYSHDDNSLNFIKMDGKTRKVILENLKPEKLIKKIDAMVKPNKLNITKTDRV